MRQQVLTALILAIASTAATRSVAQATTNGGQIRPNLKWVELDGRYRVQVPEDFTLVRISSRISSLPNFHFNATPPDNTHVQIILMPMPRTYPTDPETGRPRIEMDGIALNRYLEISRGTVVSYGWRVDDTANECTMNTPCPVPVPRSVRYRTLYVFAAFDIAHSTIVEFRGDYFGATQNVKTLKGDGELLRKVIVPSLSSVNEQH